MLISSSDRLRSRRRRQRLAAKANFPLSEVLSREDGDLAPWLWVIEETHLSGDLRSPPS